eukprot:TRINITY_DN2198_c0_g1_i23.p1 TRINITY_DN2198_c0_g1~~TRINITY_DN2198_c0_g1_i23.p1  ORF type:complete len:749 (-),score=92.53 TRINITY_DN2198_c0_g1_i23:314-2404(-)
MKFRGCAPLPDGRVVLAPFHYPCVVIFNPANGSFEEFTHLTGKVKFSSCTVLLDGRVLLAPFMYPSVLIFDPSDGSCNELAHFEVHNDLKFSSCSTLHDGRVLLAPANYPSIVVLDPTDGNYEEVGSRFELARHHWAFSACTTMPDGRVVLAPRDHNTIVVFDPVSGGCESVGCFEGRDSFFSSSLMPDGTLILVPDFHSSFIALSCDAWQQTGKQSNELPEALWKERLFTDAVIVAGDDAGTAAGSAPKRIPVHRAVLASKSEFFRTLFESSFRDSVDAVVSFPEEAAVVESMLQYLYTGCVPQADLLGVILLAHRLGLSDCISACADAFKNDLPHDCVPSALKMFYPLKSHPVINGLWDFLLDEIHEDKALLSDVLDIIVSIHSNDAHEHMSSSSVFPEEKVPMPALQTDSDKSNTREAGTQTTACANQEQESQSSFQFGLTHSLRHERPQHIDCFEHSPMGAKYMILHFHRAPSELKDALSSSALGRILGSKGAHIAPSWANGAKVLDENITPEVLQRNGHDPSSLRPWHVIVKVEDVSCVFESLRCVPYHRRPRAKAKLSRTGFLEGDRTYHSKHNEPMHVEIEGFGHTTYTACSESASAETHHLQHRRQYARQPERASTNAASERAVAIDRETAAAISEAIAASFMEDHYMHGTAGEDLLASSGAYVQKKTFIHVNEDASSSLSPRTYVTA